MSDDKNIPITRSSLIDEHRKNLVTYLKLKNPNVSEKVIYDFVTKKITENIKRPKATIVNYPSHGNIEQKEVDLLNQTKQYSNKTVSPFGTFYETADVNIPHICQFSIELTNLRKKYKKEMFTHLENGNTFEASMSNYDQGNTKIFNNSVSGGFGSVSNALYDKESYNAITSLARYSTISAYGFAERFLASNLYLTNSKNVINSLVVMVRQCPSKEIVESTMSKHNLYNVSADMILDMLRTSMSKYLSRGTISKILRDVDPIVSNMESYQKAYVYYGQNLYNMMTTNGEYFKNFLESIIFINPADYENIDTTVLGYIDDDLLQMCTVVHSDLLEGNNLSKIKENHPEILKKLVFICNEIQNKFSYIQDIFDTFLSAKGGVPDALSHRAMLREAIIISDTDSVIFTVIKLARWYQEERNGINDRSNEIFRFPYKPNKKTKMVLNDVYAKTIYAFSTYMLSKGIRSLLNITSYNRGCVGDNIKRVNMKNEYFYPIMLRTDRSKHYTGKMTIQEGITLPKPKIDIKGVNFKNSSVPKSTSKLVNSIVRDIMDEVEEHGDLYAGEYIQRCLDYELSILDSIEAGRVDFYPNTSVKHEREYKNPDSSIYFNYKVWQEVFGPKYGNINIPTKCPLVPLNKGAIRSEAYMKMLEATSPDIAKNLKKFLDKIDIKKNIGRIPISDTLESVPKELIPIIDKRSIIYKNSALIQLPMKSILVDLGDSKRRPLFIDTYSTREV